MIEKTVLNYLKSTIKDVEIRMETPTPMLDEFITIEKTGSGEIRNMIRQSTLAIQSWSTSKLRAAELSARVCEAMNNFIVVDEILSSTGGDYDFTDIETKRYRYQAVYTVNHY